MSAVPEASTERGWDAWHHTAWRVINFSTMPVWVLMILLPNSKATARVVAGTAPLHAGLGLTYLGMLARSAMTGTERVDFMSGPSVARGLANPEGMLAGWTHYLTFDLFVGEWIWQTAKDENINARLATLLSWWFGPVGLTLFLWQRRHAKVSGPVRPV